MEFEKGIKWFWAFWVVSALGGVGLMGFGIWVVVKVLQFIGII